MVRITSCCVLLLLSSCSRPGSIQSLYGPTVQVKLPSGYQLLNRKIAILIHDQNGFASRMSPGGCMSQFSIFPTVGGDTETSPTDGYVEARDEETLQYIGQSKDGRFGWRIVYCLYYDHLNVTYLLQNKTPEPVTVVIRLSNAAYAAIQPFNEDPTLNATSADGSVRSDERTLKPGERMNFATRWKLDK